MTVCRDVTIVPALDALRKCVATQLGTCDRGVCRFPIVANGSHPPADACTCDCDSGTGHGQAWVRMVTLNRGGGTTNMGGCFNGMFDVTLETGLYRCWPVPHNADSALPEQAETAAAEALYLDAALLRRAVLCCDWFTDRDIVPIINHESFIGPSGGCIGVELQLVVNLSECPCPQQQGGTR